MNIVGQIDKVNNMLKYLKIGYINMLLNSLISKPEISDQKFNSIIMINSDISPS